MPNLRQDSATSTPASLAFTPEPAQSESEDNYRWPRGRSSARSRAGRATGRCLAGNSSANPDARSHDGPPLCSLCVRTTLDISDDVLVALKRRAAETQKPLREVIEDALREGLARRDQR